MTEKREYSPRVYQVRGYTKEVLEKYLIDNLIQTRTDAFKKIGINRYIHDRLVNGYPISMKYIKNIIKSGLPITITS